MENVHKAWTFSSPILNIKELVFYSVLVSFL